MVQDVFPIVGPQPAFVSPEKLIAMQILRLHPRLQYLTQGGSGILIFIIPPGAHLQLNAYPLLWSLLQEKDLFHHFAKMLFMITTLSHGRHASSFRQLQPTCTDPDIKGDRLMVPKCPGIQEILFQCSL